MFFTPWFRSREFSSRVTRTRRDVRRRVLGGGIEPLEQRLLLSAAPDFAWLHQIGGEFGSTDEVARAADSDGNVYVTGTTDGALPGQTPAGGLDAFVSKYDADGTEVWTRQFGTSKSDEAYGISVDASGVYVVGITSGTFPGQSNQGGNDGFVRKYDLGGDHLWTRQFGTSATEFVFGTALDATGVYITGMTTGVFSGQSSSGNEDAFVRKYDTGGTEVWTRQFGTSSFDRGYGISAEATGVYVAGLTRGTFPGETSAGGVDAFVRKFDTDGTEAWTRQFGTSAFDQPFGVSADASGVYVAGVTSGSFPDQTSEGGNDAFVRKYDIDGTEVWTRQFGTGFSDEALGVSVDASGVYVAGVTGGSLPGQSTAGGSDAFVRKYETDGTEDWTRQFGTSFADRALGVSVDAAGVYVAGRTFGTFPGETTLGGADAFVGKLAFTSDNTAPVADDDSYTTDEDTSLSIPAATGVLSNDNDDDVGDTLAVSEVNGLAANVGTQITLGSGALLTVNADGSLTFDPNGQFEALAAGASTTNDFTYTVTDSQGATDDATVTVTIDGVNDAPSITSAAAVSVEENQPSALNVQSSDPEGETEDGAGLTYSLTGGVDQLLFSIDGNTGLLTFDAPPNFESPADVGEDNLYEVQVTVTDSGLLTGLQDIAVTVTNVNEPPLVASPIDDVTANENAPGDTIDLSSVFDDVDAGDTLTLTVTGNTNLTLLNASVLGTNLTLDYLVGQSGTAEITIRATDSAGEFIENSFAVTVLSAQQQIERIIKGIQDLVAASVLNGGQGNSLTTKLAGAIEKLDRGNTKSAVNQLNAFINQVNAFIKSGKLTAGEGLAFIVATNHVIQSASNTSGAALMNQANSESSTVAGGSPVAQAAELVTGTVGVFFDDATAAITTDQRARFHDSIDTLNAAFGAYGVTLVEVAADDAVIVVEVAANSECGAAVDGILGCTVAHRVTLLSDWNWYAGADSLLIGGDQYDLQTILTHELGHSAGLAHSGDAGSVMYQMLATSQSRRSVTATDLALLEAEADSTPQPLLAAPRGEVHGGVPLSNQHLVSARLPVSFPDLFADSDGGPVIVGEEIRSLPDHSRIAFDRIGGATFAARRGDRSARALRRDVRFQSLDARKSPAPEDVDRLFGDRLVDDLLRGISPFK
jgi:VCBS repeat-containing protein